MRKLILNNTDRWLINRWQKAIQLEMALANARKRWEELFDEVRKNAKPAGLDLMDTYASQRDMEKYGSNVVFSKSNWQRKPGYWRDGIYFCGLTLDELADERVDDPSVCIYTHMPSTTLEKCRQQILATAPRIFRGEKFKPISEDEDKQVLLWYWLPERKQKILRMLLCSHENEFIACVSKHLLLMAKLIPVLDKFLLAKANGL